jgi:cation diffusion facilitator CzcD-associated flavoprotein CzcO
MVNSSVRVAIVGSGFAGLGLAIRMRQQGIDDFVVLERADEVGGTWRDNTYPGLTCDVPSHLYSFSFAPNADWSRSFSPQAEILEYLKGCADRYGIRRFVRFGHEVKAARWDDQAQRWCIETSQGEWTAQVLVAGMGPLSEPSTPELSGLDTFEGTTFHSAAWDHAHDLTGERVAVVGTGASSIQFVPQIQPEVAGLQVYQRTAPWIVPRTDRRISRLERFLLRRMPGVQRAWRAAIYWGRETYAWGFVKPRRIRHLQRLAIAHMRRQVRDPGLREKLTPDYVIGCKRILISNDYYPALTRPNVEVVTDGITEVRPHSIVTADGTERTVDTIIFGTGFHVTDPPAAGRLWGEGGILLADAWRDGMEAYLGSTIAGFPNLFMLIGPNTGLGHTSMVFMIESQISYVLDCLRTMDEQGLASVDVRPVSSGPTTRSSRPSWRTRSGTWVAARAGISTTGAGTPRSGPPTPGASGAAPAASTPTRTRRWRPLPPGRTPSWPRRDRAAEPRNLHRNARIRALSGPASGRMAAANALSGRHDPPVA